MKNNIFKVAGNIMIFNLFSKLLGFLRDYLTAIKFGTTIQADAFTMASNIPNVLFTMIGIAVTTTFVPIYNDIKVNDNKSNLQKFTSNVITIMITISILLTLFMEVCAPLIVKCMAPGFIGDKFILTVVLSRILASVIIINTLVYIFMAILQCESKFNIPSAIGIPYNLVLILYFVFFCDKFGVVGISIITSLALFMQVILLYLSLRKIKFKYKFIFDIKDKYIKKMIFLLIPVTIGTSMQQINGLFNGIFASSLQSGSVAALNYGNKIYTLIVEIIIMSIITVTYQNLSASAAKEDYKDIERNVNSSMVIIFMILIPIFFIILILNIPIIKVLFQRGQFNYESTVMTSNALLFYSIGLFGVGINVLLSRLCYAMNNTKLPMITTVYAVIINIILGFILKGIMGVGGIALASSIGTIIGAIILYSQISKKVSNCITLETVKTIGKLIISILPGITILYMGKMYIENLSNNITQFTIIVLISLISIIIYVIIAYILKIKEVRNVMELFKLKKHI